MYSTVLVPRAANDVRAEIAQVLTAFGDQVLPPVVESRASIRPLCQHERYAEALSALRRLGINVDSWPAPLAGPFAIEERTESLRRLSPMTIAHAFGYALDCALGVGVYFSGISTGVRQVFLGA